MKPFSPLYFICANKLRCILLMFMIFLSYGVYLGGLYVSNPTDNWKLALSYSDKCIRVFPANGDEDEDISKQYNEFRKELELNEKVTIINNGRFGGMEWKTVMGFTMGIESYAFRTPQDFRTFCGLMGIECDLDAIKPGSIVMSELFAKNAGYKLGDTVSEETTDRVMGKYTISALTKECGYILYLVDEEPYEFPGLIVVGNGVSGEELRKIVYDAKSRNNVDVDDGLADQVESQLEIFNLIYTFIVIFLSIILAVTINAAFVGMYQRRSFEFAVYRAIGISKRKIRRKIVGELLIIDLITLLVGGALFFLILYLINNLLLYPSGLYLKYYDPTAIFGLALCNLTVIVPLILTRYRQLIRADICEY